MASIQTVPGSSQVATPEASVKQSFGALNAPYQAQGQLAGAISDIGQEAAGFAQQLQAAKNFGIAADADRAMRQASADFKESRVGRTDEENWGTEWRDKANEVRASIYDKGGIGPDLRRTLDNNFKNWNQANAIEVRTIAQKQAINRVRISAADSAEEAAKDGDEAGVIAAFKGATMHGAYYPEEANHLIKQGLSKIDQYAADNFIASNPAKAVDWLKETDSDGNFVNAARINPAQRRITIANAERASRSFQIDNANEMLLSVNNGIAIDEPEILSAENEKLITPRQATGVRNAIKAAGSQTKLENQPQFGAAVKAAINAIPQDIDNDTRRSYILGIKTSKEYLGLVAPVREELDKWMNQDAMAEKPVVSEALKHAEQMYQAGFFLPRATEDVKTDSGHWFIPDKVTGQKMSDKPDVGEGDAAHWLTTAPKAIVDAAQMHYAQYLTRMRAFSKANPKASDADVTKESQRLMEPYVMSAVAQSLRPQIAAPSFTKGKRVKQDGKVYEFDGKDWNEVP